MRGLQKTQIYGIHPAGLELAYGDWDADQLVRAGGADGDLVSALPGIGTFGVTATASGSARPTLKTEGNGIGNRAVLLFDRAATRMDVSGIVALGGFSGSDKPATIAYVASYSAPSGDVLFSFGNVASATGSMTARVHAAGELSMRRIDDSGTTKSPASGTAMVADTPAVVVEVFTGATAAIWKNATQVLAPTDMDVGAATMDVATIGCWLRNGTANFFGGKLGRILVFAGAATDWQAVSLSKWLMRRYRIS